MYLINVMFSLALGPDVRDVHDDSPRTDVNIDAQVEELVQRHDQPCVVLLRVYLH